MFCYPPDGFEEQDYIWQLKRALYGLKTSPLLWYKDLTRTLEELGLRPVPDVNCLYRNDKLIVFFYVDDIVVLVKLAYLTHLENFERKLFKRYQICALGELSLFCGIYVIRDRANAKIWLC